MKKINSQKEARSIMGHELGYLLILLMPLVSCLAMGLGCGSRSNSQEQITKETSNSEDNPRLKKLIAYLEGRRHGGFFSSLHRNAEGKIDKVALFGEDAVDDNMELITSLPNLEFLCLGCCADNPGMSVNTFDLLKRANRLKVLQLYGAVLLKKMKKLKKMDLHLEQQENL